MINNFTMENKPGFYIFIIRMNKEILLAKFVKY